MSLKGRLISKQNGNAIEYATIVIYSSKDSTVAGRSTSDSNGLFIVQNLVPGRYYLEAHLIGFQKIAIKEIIVSNENNPLDCGEIKMDDAYVELNDLVVEGERNVVQYKVDKKIVNVSKKLDAQGRSVAYALENTPSVQVDSDGNLLLRGSSNFTVLIDGKPAALSGSDALKQIPASIVENVEIITNPSAKYDPDGTAGIINVIMKKNLEKNLNGIAGISMGNGSNYGAEITLNYRKEKINTFIKANYNNILNEYKLNLNREICLSDTVSNVKQAAHRSQLNLPISIGTGIDWNINKSNSLSLRYDIGYWGMDLDINTKASESIFPVGILKYSDILSEIKSNGIYHTGSISFTHNFPKKGHELTASAIASIWNGNNSTEVNTVDESHYLSQQIDENLAMRGKVDYSLPIGENSKFEAGFQGNIRKIFTDYQIRFFDYDSQNWNNWQTIPNKMELNQHVNSLYSTYSTKLGEIDAQLGLRVEFYDRNFRVPVNAGNSTPVTYETHKLNETDFFPTLHLTRRFAKGLQLQASYSKRVNRPREWNLNPIPVYSDSYISQVGNPKLLPEFTHSFEFNVIRPFKLGHISLEAYYSQTENAFTRTMNLDSKGVLHIGLDNLGKNYSYGTELSVNLQAVKWLNINATGNFYSYNIEGNLVETTDTRSTNFDCTLNSTFRLFKDTRLQLVGFYNAPKVTPQGRQNYIYGANLSVSQELMKRRMTIVLSGRNILNSVKYSFNTITGNLKSDYKLDYPTIFTISISYKINNYKRSTNENNSGQEFTTGGIF